MTATVTDDKEAPLSEVLLTLKESNNDIVSTTLTIDIGEHVFDDVEHGVYTVMETNAPEYAANVVDQDFTNGFDPTDNSTAVDNIIGAELNPGETDKTMKIRHFPALKCS